MRVSLADGGTGVAKLVQSWVSHHIVFTTGTGRRVIISQYHPSGLSMVSRNSTECLLRAVQEACPQPPGLCDLFARRLRILLCDSYAANNKLDRWLREKEKFSHFSPRCLAHKAALAFKKMKPLVDDDTKGAMHTTLWLSMTSHLKALKDALGCLIEERLVCVRDPLSEEARLYRCAVMDAYIQDQKPSQRAWRRYVLEVSTARLGHCQSKTPKPHVISQVLH